MHNFATYYCSLTTFLGIFFGMFFFKSWFRLLFKMFRESKAKKVFFKKMPKKTQTFEK